MTAHRARLARMAAFPFLGLPYDGFNNPSA